LLLKGSSHPLSGSGVQASSHGVKGLGGFTYRKMSKNVVKNLFEAEITRELNDPITIIALGPLTNVAKVLRDQEFARKVDKVIILAGTVSKGNITDYAEFNAYNDPEALNEVLRSSVRNKILMPIDVCRNVVFDESDFKADEFKGEILDMLRPYISYYKNDNDFGGYDGAILYDLLAVMYETSSQLFTTRYASVSFVTKGSRKGTLLEINSGSTIKLVVDVNSVAVRQEYRTVTGFNKN
jgi:inosine-uridine nucleoside N-ribohydrolase